MDNEFYCDFKLLTFGMHCNKYISSLVCKNTWGNTFHGSSSRALHFLPAQTSIHTAWTVVKYQGVLNDFQENILASGKVLFVSLYKVWDVSLSVGKLHTFSLVKTSVLHVTATYYDKYCCVELGTAFTWNRQIQIDITLVLNYT